MKPLFRAVSWRVLPALMVVGTLAAAGGVTASEAPRTVVVFAPGYPGNSVDAQPTMDRFAATVADITGWDPATLRAEYHQTVDGGRERIRAGDTVVAIVPYAFLWSEGDALGLEPLLQVVRDHGSKETWSLVSGKGRVSAPDDLAAWEITGLPGFSPAFVREQVLGSWGALPDSTRITFGPRVVSALRRATRGEDVVVLLDPPQSDALPALPFGGELEVVVRSVELPGFVVCRVGERLDGEMTTSLRAALVRLHKKKEGRETLESMRMVRFEPLDRSLATPAGDGTGTP